MKNLAVILASLLATGSLCAQAVDPTKLGSLHDAGTAFERGLSDPGASVEQVADLRQKLEREAAGFEGRPGTAEEKKVAELYAAAAREYAAARERFDRDKSRDAFFKDLRRVQTELKEADELFKGTAKVTPVAPPANPAPPTPTSPPPPPPQHERPAPGLPAVPPAAPPPPRVPIPAPGVTPPAPAPPPTKAPPPPEPTTPAPTPPPPVVAASPLPPPPLPPAPPPVIVAPPAVPVPPPPPPPQVDVAPPAPVVEPLPMKTPPLKTPQPPIVAPPVATEPPPAPPAITPPPEPVPLPAMAPPPPPLPRADVSLNNFRKAANRVKIDKDAKAVSGCPKIADISAPNFGSGVYEIAGHNFYYGNAEELIRLKTAEAGGDRFVLKDKSKTAISGEAYRCGK